MSQSKDNTEVDPAYAYPEQGNALEALQGTDDAPHYRPKVTIIDENGKTEVTRKVISEEQIQKKFAEDAPYSEKNPSFTNIAGEIPSSMCFYPGTSLCIQTFRTPHIIKLIEAMEMEDLGMVVEAVSSALEPTFSAFDLTPEDFFYCLYWLKINSFKKHPFSQKFVCNNPAHHEKVLLGDLPKETLINEAIIKNTGELTVTRITPEVLDNASRILNRIKEDHGVDVFPLRMRDYVDLQGYLKRTTMLGAKIDALEAEGDFESETLTELRAAKRTLDASYAMKDYAPYVCMESPKATVADKINYLNELDLGPDFLGDLDEFIQATSHGVKETVVADCKECKAKVEINVSIDALQFFPEIIRRRFAQ